MYSCEYGVSTYVWRGLYHSWDDGELYLERPMTAFPGYLEVLMVSFLEYLEVLMTSFLKFLLIRIT
jgi:hypothetical protein